MGHQERECNKAKKGYISSEEDDYQFGPWLRVVGPKINRGRISYNKSKSGEVEDDIYQESDEEKGDKQLSPNPCRLQISLLIRKSSRETIIAISLDESIEISSCQVTSQSQNLVLNSNVRSNSHPFNLEKLTPLSFSNSNLTEKPKQRILELSPSITVINLEILILDPMENNSPNNPLTQMYPHPQHLGGEEILPGTNKNSKKLKETEFENLNSDFLNNDIEMELSPNISEDSLGHIKTSLQSWKQLLRNSNPTLLSIDNEKPMFQTHIKRTSSSSSSVESLIHKKLAIESSFGDTFPQCHPL